MLLYLQSQLSQILYFKSKWDQVETSTAWQWVINTSSVKLFFQLSCISYALFYFRLSTNRHVLHPRWLTLLKIEISLINHELNFKLLCLTTNSFKIVSDSIAHHPRWLTSLIIYFWQLQLYFKLKWTDLWFVLFQNYMGHLSHTFKIITSTKKYKLFEQHKWPILSWN